MSIANVNSVADTYYGIKQSVKRFSGLTMNAEGGFSFKEEPLEGGFANLVNPEEFQRKWMEQNNNHKVDYYFGHSLDVEKEDQRMGAYLQMKYANAATAKQIYMNYQSENYLLKADNQKQVSAKDMLSAVFPANDVSVKAGNCDIASEIWERKDFPVWQYFQDDVSANSLNNWKLTGAEPTGAESYIQQELRKIGFGEIVVMIPENLYKKMEADPEYAQEIAEKVQKWKTNYDRMDNAVAASYGNDPALYQMTKSYCIQLDEEGNIENYIVVSGGIDTQKTNEKSKIENEVSQKAVTKAVKQKSVQREAANTITGLEEVDYTNIVPYLIEFYKNRQT